MKHTNSVPDGGAHAQRGRVEADIVCSIFWASTQCRSGTRYPSAARALLKEVATDPSAARALLSAAAPA